MTIHLTLLIRQCFLRALPHLVGVWPQAVHGTGQSVHGPPVRVYAKGAGADVEGGRICRGGGYESGEIV